MSEIKDVQQAILAASEFQFLNGKTIAYVRRMTDEELECFHYSGNPVIIFFTDNSYLMPLSDEEGNDVGAIEWVSSKDENKTLHRSPRYCRVKM